MLSVGCLLIGTNAERNMRLRQELSDRGILTVCGEWRSDLLKDMQKELYGVRKQAARICVAAEGEMWTAALALAVQLCVDRVVLIHPSAGNGVQDSCMRRQLNRLNGYVKRNLFFCVSDLLVVDPEMEMRRDMDAVLGRMVNARIWRMRAASGDVAEPTVRFMLCDDFGKTEYACE